MVLLPLSPMLQWLLFHTLAGIAIGALEAGQFQFMATLVFSGLFVGIAQWLVLRRILQRATCWIWASAIGWLLGIQLMIFLGEWLDRIAVPLSRWGGGEVFWLNVVNQPIALLGLGAAQSLLLQLGYFPSRGSQRRSWMGLSRMGWSWIGISIAAGAIQGGSSALFCAFFCPVLTGQLGTILTTAIVYGVGWFSYSVTTAPLLHRLLF